MFLGLSELFLQMFKFQILTEFPINTKNSELLYS